MTTDPFAQPTQASQPGDIINGRYHLPHPETMQPHKWTRTTNYIEKIADKYAIHEWDKRNIIQGLVMREDLYLEACATDLGDAKALNDIASRAKEIAGGNTGARLGTAFHGFTERAKRGEETQAPRKWQGKVDVYLKTLAANHLTPRPDLLERKVVSLRYNLAGTFDDGLQTLDLGLVVGDTKSQKELFTYSQMAMQLGVYANADAMWDPVRGLYEDMPPFNKEKGILLWTPVRGIGETEDVCEPHWVDIAHGWRMLEVVSAVHEFQKAGKRKNEVGGLYVPSSPLNVTEDYAQRLREASTVEELSAIYRECTARGVWGPELEELGLSRKKYLNDLVSTVDTLSTVN